VALLGAVNFLIGYFWLPETLPYHRRRNIEWLKATSIGTVSFFRQNRTIIPLAVSLLLFQVSYWTVPSVWAYFAEERFGWSPIEIGYSLMLYGLSAAIVQGIAIRFVVSTFSKRSLALFGIGVTACCFVGYSIVADGALAVTLIIISAIGGLALPALHGMMSSHIRSDSQGELQGFLASMAGLSMIIGPYLITQVFAMFIDPGAPATIGVIVVFSEGAPIYFPGAPFVFAAILTSLAILPLRSSKGPSGIARI